MPREFDINSSTIPVFAEYFYALKFGEDTDIFNTSVGSFDLEPRPKYLSFDVVDKIINPLKTKGVLKTDVSASKLLVPLEGLLILPDDPPATGKYPLVILCHGNHAGYATLDFRTHKPSGSTPGRYVIDILPAQRPSYTGYKDFQKTLATSGIASYSINVNIVNSLENGEHGPFEKIAVDANQRVLLFFLHLKLMKMIAADTLTGDNHPIRFVEGTTFRNLKDVLPSTTHAELLSVKTAILSKLDFTKLGVMGHSRGADAVSRIHPYCFQGTTQATRTFTVHPKVDDMIVSLAQQTRPQQDHIKSILALQPVAAKKENASDTEGYVFNNKQTMFFVGVGTHDEDVTFDPVRLYEHPTCPKVMIAINGATHKRFNTVWALTRDPEEFTEEPVNIHILDVKQHTDIMQNVFAKCFTATLTGASSDFLYFTKHSKFPVSLPAANHIQLAWEFGFPFATTPAEMKDMDTKVQDIDTRKLDGTGFPFEQEISAFVEKRQNEGIFTFRVDINRDDDTENLSKYSHISFRFAKGLKLNNDNAEKPEYKNFTVEFFENDTLQGTTIEGRDITTLELKAVRAFDENFDSAGNNPFVYSILMQTAEIALKDRPDTAKTTRMVIKIVPDTNKSAPRSGKARVGGSVLWGLAGGAVGLVIAHIYNKAQNVPEEDRTRNLLIGGVSLGAITWLIAFVKLKSDEYGFAFKDFLLTNRNIP